MIAQQREVRPIGNIEAHERADVRHGRLEEREELPRRDDGPERHAARRPQRNAHGERRNLERWRDGRGKRRLRGIGKAVPAEKRAVRVRALLKSVLVEPLGTAGVGNALLLDEPADLLLPGLARGHHLHEQAPG